MHTLALTYPHRQSESKLAKYLPPHSHRGLGRTQVNYAIAQGHHGTALPIQGTNPLPGGFASIQFIMPNYQGLLGWHDLAHLRHAWTAVRHLLIQYPLIVNNRVTHACTSHT